MANFILDKFYLFFQGALVFHTLFLIFLYFITLKKDILFYAGYLFFNTAYFFLNAPNTFFNLNDEVVFKSALYIYFNIPIIIVTQLLYLLFLRTFFTEIYQNKSLKIFYKIIIFFIPFLLGIFYLLRLFHQPTQVIFYIANFLGTIFTIYLLIIISAKNFIASKWILTGMVINLTGNALTILMIILERYGIKNVLTYDYPLVFMRIGILVDIFFYMIAFLKKWHIQEKQLALKEIEKQLEIATIRNKISSQLHDDIGGTVSGISMYVHLLENNLAKNELEHAHKSIRIIQKSTNLIISNLNNLVWSVNPMHDNFEKLLNALKEFGEELCFPKGIKFICYIDKQIANKKISEEISYQLFFCIKESINNAVKHSNAHIINLDFIETFPTSTIIIKDDGDGFDINEMAKGNGLSNIKNRIGLINGKYTIESDNIKGTILKITI